MRSSKAAPTILSGDVPAQCPAPQPALCKSKLHRNYFNVLYRVFWMYILNKHLIFTVKHLLTYKKINIKTTNIFIWSVQKSSYCNYNLQYPCGKQFLCSFPHSSSNASLLLTSLPWVGSSVPLTSNFTSRGSRKLTIQVLKIRTVRPESQRTETRKEQRKQPVWKPGIYSIQKKMLKMLLCVCVQYLLWY